MKILRKLCQLYHQIFLLNTSSELYHLQNQFNFISLFYFTPIHVSHVSAFSEREKKKNLLTHVGIKLAFNVYMKVRLILREEVEETIKVYNKEKSAGADNIPAELVHVGGEAKIDATTSVCNTIWQNSRMAFPMG